MPQGLFGNMLEDFVSDSWMPSFRMPETETFKPDIKEDGGSYTVEAEVPGVRKEDIALDLDGGRLTIGVAGRESVEEDKKKPVHKERRFTCMERSIYLADAAETGAKARLEHGELIVTVPKQRTGGSGRKIEIQ